MCAVSCGIWKGEMTKIASRNRKERICTLSYVQTHKRVCFTTHSLCFTISHHILVFFFSDVYKKKWGFGILYTNMKACFILLWNWSEPNATGIFLVATIAMLFLAIQQVPPWQFVLSSRFFSHNISSICIYFSQVMYKKFYFFLEGWSIYM